MSGAPCFLGLDIGTFGVKGVVVASDGVSARVLAQARVEHTVSRPREGWSEQDPDAQWWGDSVAVIRDLLTQRGVDSQSIAAVGVSGLTPCLCLLDAEGDPLRPAILYNDNRALPQLARAQTLLGTPLTAQAVTPKWAWLVEHEPEAPAQAAHICSSHHYVVSRLTGRLVMDYDTASIFGGIFDTQRNAWDADACARLGLDARLLPPLLAVTELAGEITDAAAQSTGLRAGTSVIVGTGDTFPTIVGCGAIDPGDAMIAFGTTGLLTLTARPLVEAAAGPHFQDASEGGAVEWAANVLACGRLLTWYREGFGAALAGCEEGPDGVPDFASLDRVAAVIPAGSEGLVALPHLMGRRTPTPDPQARGVLFGLTPGHTAAHVYRALLESFGYAVRRGYDPIQSRVCRVIATAGGAASPLWRQIVADILTTPVEYYDRAGGALGMAFLAAYATGAVDRFSAIRDVWLGQPRLTLPHPANTRRYDDLYRLYCHLDDNLAPAFDLLANASGS